VRTLEFQQIPDYESLKTIIGNFSYCMKALQTKILDKCIHFIFKEA
jgi:hypothetical protein